MNQARLEILTEKLQDHCMSESECQELMEWLESDVSHMVAFAEQLRLSNALGTLRLIGCDGIAPAVMSSLAGVKGTSDLSRKVRLQIEKDKQSELLHHDNNVHFRKLATWLLATAATFFVIVGWLALRKDHELIDDGLVIARVTN